MRLTKCPRREIHRYLLSSARYEDSSRSAIWPEKTSPLTQDRLPNDLDRPH